MGLRPSPTGPSDNPTGPLFLAFGDSRVNPSLLHTKDMQDRWASRLARELGMQLRNLGVGGSSILGESGTEPLPRMLAYLMGVHGPGYDYTLADTTRQPPPALITLYDAYNTLFKWDFTANPAFWDTAENCYETFCRLARSDYFFPVGTTIAAPHWSFGAGWSVGALNTNYGVGPTNRVAASGDGSFTFDLGALGGGNWPGGDLTVIVRARKDIDDSPNWRCRIRAKIGAGAYIATYDSTGGTPGVPALGVDGGAALTSFVVPIPAGTTGLVTFDVDSIVGQCTIMGAALEIGDKADWPSPVVTLAQQPHIIASPDGTHPQITNAVVDQLNALLADVASRFPDGRVGVVELPSVIDGQAAGGDRWFKDNVHHSNLGNAVIAREHASAISVLGLSPTHSAADLTCVGTPTWVSYPGDAVWDRVARHWWYMLDDPELAVSGVNRKVWTADSIRNIPSSAITPPVASKLGLLLLQSAKAALGAALTPYGVRIEAERDGDLRHIAFNIGTLSGSVAVMVYDTGDAQGGAIGTRTKLWASGSVLMSGMTAGQWGTIDPGAGVIPVKAGQHLDILLASSDTGSSFLRASVGGNSLTIPTVHLPVPGGAAPKLGFKYPVVADLAAATAPDTVVAGNVTGQDVVPYLSASVA